MKSSEKKVVMPRTPFCVLLGVAVAFQAPAAELPAKSPHVWEKVEITLQSQRQYEDSYTDVQVWVDLKGPGFDKRCYGFWDGGSNRIVRGPRFPVCPPARITRPAGMTRVQAAGWKQTHPPK